MTKRTYDTRSSQKIIAGPVFDGLRELPGLADLPTRELRMLDRFLTWASELQIETPGTEDFLRFAERAESKRALADLRTAFNRILPPNAAALGELRDALRAVRPASRRCDWRDRDTILSGPQFEPYRDAPGLGEVSLEDLRALDLFLVFAEERGIEVPTVGNFLAFASDVRSTRRLRAVEAALTRIIPGNPAVLLTLRQAIERKAPFAQRAEAPQRPCILGVDRHDLPAEWRETLERIRADALFAPSTVKSMEDVLRSYAGSLRDAGMPFDITVEGLRLHEKRLRDRKGRPATLSTHTLRLLQFAKHHGVADAIREDLSRHYRNLRKKLGRVVPLKEARHAALPSLTQTWSLAERLLAEARDAPHRGPARRLRNEATVVALWSFLPLRLADSTLRWGEDICWEEDAYRVSIVTQKADVPLSGRLHARLTPFLDALLLEGVSVEYLEEMRARGETQRLPLLRRYDGQPLAHDYPSTVWRKHFGTGAHIARTRIHTELGKLGPAGVESALALCAQRDPRTREFYQARSLADLEMQRGQELVGNLLNDLGCLE